MSCGSMWKNNIFLSLTFLGLFVFPIFNLANASKYSSDKKSQTCFGRDGKCDEISEGSDVKVTLKLHVEESNEDGITARIKTANEHNSDILNLSEGDKNGNVHAQSKDSDKENIADSYSDIVDKFNLKEKNADEAVDMKRTFRAGDICTPYELLPVTKRLLAKVELPEGTGRGIVSESKSPEALADKIFAAYFLTTKRIIVLKDLDIDGLDELQLLALKDDPKNLKYMVRTMTKVPKIVIRNPDKELESYLPPRRSRYKLLTKKESKKEIDSERRIEKMRIRNMMLNLEKKMNKNRHLIVNSKSKNRKHGRRMQSFRRALLEPGCTWHYECREPHDLESCHLKAKCNNETLSNGYMDGVITPSPKEVTMSPNFRRAVGLDPIDEAVEKIIANHVLLVKPENLQKNKNIESLDEYFNKLVKAQHAGTTPIAPMKYKENSNDEETKSDPKGKLYRKTEKKPDWAVPQLGIP